MLNRFSKEKHPLNHSIDPATTLLLKYHQQVTLPRYNPHHPLNYEELKNEFCKWPEQTSTSPSGHHLGIYKSLIKDVQDPKKKKDSTKTNNNHKTPSNHNDTTPPNTGPKNSEAMMHLIFDMLQLAVTHTHTFKRWKVVWNLFLEKDPSTPKINQLRVIHLMEADWNLLLKWFSSQSFFKHAEENSILIDNQGGSQKGWSAIELVCKKVLSFDFICTTQTKAINIENNAKACFDLMVVACHSLSCLFHGADPVYIQLHTQAQCSPSIILAKHGHAISKEYNSYTTKNPWYGASQGAVDMAIRWIILSCCLIRAYLSKAHQWVMHHPNCTIALKQNINAFINNTTLVIRQTTQST